MKTTPQAMVKFEASLTREPCLAPRSLVARGTRCHFDAGMSRASAILRSSVMHVDSRCITSGSRSPQSSRSWSLAPRSSEQSSRPAASPCGCVITHWARPVICLSCCPKRASSEDDEQRWRLAGLPRRAMRLEYGSASHPCSLAIQRLQPEGCEAFPCAVRRALRLPSVLGGSPSRRARSHSQKQRKRP